VTKKPKYSVKKSSLQRLRLKWKLILLWLFN